MVLHPHHKLAKAISDCGWGTFTNFLAYKLEREGAKLVEIDRWFPSSKLCSNCFYQMGEMPLDVREWTCPHCGTHDDRDGNAAINIRAEGIRMLALSGVEVLKVSQCGLGVSPSGATGEPVRAEGSAVWCCRRGGKTQDGTKVSFRALAYEYRSPVRLYGGVVHV